MRHLGQIPLPVAETPSACADTGPLTACVVRLRHWLIPWFRLTMCLPWSSLAASFRPAFTSLALSLGASARVVALQREGF